MLTLITFAVRCVRWMVRVVSIGLGLNLGGKKGAVTAALSRFGSL